MNQPNDRARFYNRAQEKDAENMEELETNYESRLWRANEILADVIDGCKDHKIRIALNSISRALETEQPLIRSLEVKGADDLLESADLPENPLDRQDVREAHQLVIAAHEELNPQ